MAEEDIKRKISIWINDKEVNDSLGGIGREIGKLKREIREATDPADRARLNKQLTETKKRYADINTEINGTNGFLDKMKAKLGPIASGFLAAFSIGALVTGAMAALRGATKTINDFEQGIADLKAITGATGDDLEYLKKQTIDLGVKTKGGAIAVVEAYKLIASAKPELLEDVKALNAVTEATLILAQASGMELPKAATALTDAMNQYGVDAKEAIPFVDALAAGAKYGAAEIENETESLLKFGAVARTSNVNIKESVGLIQLMAENGEKGAEAGTKLRNILLKISAPDALPKEAQAIFKELGIDMEFLKDKSIPVQQKLEALKPLLQDNANIVKVFGIENATAALNVLGHTDRLAELTSKMGEVGVASEQAAIKMDTVQGKSDLLASKYDSLILSVSTGGGAVSNFFKFWIDGASSALTGLTRLNSSWDELYARAQSDGETKGVKSFAERFNNLAGTGNDADVAKSVKEAARNTLYTLKQSYKENEEAMAAHNPWALNFSGVSPKDMKENKEKLTKEIAAYNTIISEANNKINSFENPNLGAGVPTTPGTPTTPTGSLTDDESKKREAAAKKYKEAEEQLTASIKQQQEQRAINQKEGLDKELATIDEKYRIQIEKAAGHDEQIKELEALRDQEKQDLTLQRAAEFEIKKKELQDEIDLQNATTQEEADALKLTLDSEKEILELDKLALSEIQKGELKKKIIEKYNNDIDKLTEAAALKRLQKQAEFDIQEINFEKQKSEIKIGLAQQLGGVLIGLLGDSLGAQLAAIALNAIIEVAKIQIATSAAQAINLAQAVALGPILGPPAIVAAKITNASLGATSKLQQGAVIGAAAISGLGAVLKKKSHFDGGYTGDEVIYPDEHGGIVGGVHKNEWVGPAIMTQNPKYAANFAYLEAERQRLKRGYFDGGTVTENKAAGTSFIAETSSAPAANYDQNLINAINKNSELLEYLKVHGILAVVSNKDYKSMKLLQEGINDYNDLRNTNKV
ncbi:MAG: phage tail tape measure protein [Lutibacter sp.]|jgi:TP901 family phage tail tape measure protein